MRSLNVLIITAGVVAGVALYAHADVSEMPTAAAANRSRACMPAPGAAEVLAATTSASAASTALNLGGVYYLRCDTEAYIRTGTTSPTAAAGDFKLPADTILPLGIDARNGVRYVAAKSVSVTGSCLLIECR